MPTRGFLVSWRIPQSTAGILLAALTACSAGTGIDNNQQDTGTDTVGSETDGGTEDVDEESSSESTADDDSSDDDTGGIWEQDLVAVDHPREFRAAWITTVYNINWPSSAGIDMATAQAELIAILDAAAAINLNAVVFQVRPESDAVYASDLEPWSRFLTGTQGIDPGWDPLTFLVDEGHARNLEVHAWFNPYRAAVGAGSTLAQPHIALQLPEHAHVYGSALWMDPGSIDVREHTVDVVVDVVERYDVDGVHMDDYFYPYPDGSDFPDDLTWTAYVEGGGNLSRSDWRRDNVNALVEELHDAVASVDPDVRFGIAPFGIYQPGIPEGIVGLNQYEELYADPVTWMEQGWVDYLAPQLYWPTWSVQQNYEVLLDWWTSVNPERYIFVGNYLSQLGEWDVDEIAAQVGTSRAYADANSLGNVFFHVEPILSDTMGINDVLAGQFYGSPALAPPLVDRQDETVDPPLVTVQGDGVLVEDVAQQRLRAYVVYAEVDGGWEIDRVVPAEASLSIALDSGRWAISAAGVHDVESLGVAVDVP